MDPLDTNMYFLKRYRPSDSFCTFISETVAVNHQQLLFIFTQIIITGQIIN